MLQQNADDITREEKAYHEILRRETPRAVWAMVRVVAISRFLSGKQEDAAGWMEGVWGYLLALHKRAPVQRLELGLLGFWYAWLRFNPQETAKKQNLLLSNSVKSQLLEIRLGFEAAKKRMMPVLLLLILTVLVGLGGEIGSRALMAIGETSLKASLVSPDLLWSLVAKAITIHIFVTVILLAIAITTFIYWAGRTIVGWWDYHKTVLRIKEISRRD